MRLVDRQAGADREVTAEDVERLVEPDQSESGRGWKADIDERHARGRLERKPRRNDGLVARSIGLKVEPRRNLHVEREPECLTCGHRRFLGDRLDRDAAARHLRRDRQNDRSDQRDESDEAGSASPIEIERDGAEAPT